MSTRCILVTGSSSGIGQEIVNALLESGAKVIGIARDQEKFTPSSESYWPYEIDLGDVQNLTKAVKKILSIHTNIDGFISCAGYGDFRLLENFSPSQIISFFDTNLLAHILLTKLLLPTMKKSKKFGNIIFIGSEAALRGSKKATLYSASKFGLRGFAQALREESSTSNISVTIINPGMVRTPFFDSLGFKPGVHKTNSLEPEDIASLVMSILNGRRGTVIDEINLSPLKKVISFD